MRSPVPDPTYWLTIDETPSTQSIAKECILAEGPSEVVFAWHQSAGVGRFGREWHSRRGDSLTTTLIFRAYADLETPHWLTMSVALAVAETLNLGVQWPNDVVHETKKVGGILTEMVPDPYGRRIPIVGLGVNLNQADFPMDVASRAVSLFQIDRENHSASDVLVRVLTHLRDMPEPTRWEAIQSRWTERDQTCGKRFSLPTGETAVGIGVGERGQLQCEVSGEIREILVADALFGTR